LVCFSLFLNRLRSVYQNVNLENGFVCPTLQPVADCATKSPRGELEMSAFGTMYPLQGSGRFAPHGI
jgi:hypothetical protein